MYSRSGIDNLASLLIWSFPLHCLQSSPLDTDLGIQPGRAGQRKIATPWRRTETGRPRTRGTGSSSRRRSTARSATPCSPPTATSPPMGTRTLSLPITKQWLRINYIINFDQAEVIQNGGNKKKLLQGYIIPLFLIKAISARLLALFANVVVFMLSLLCIVWMDNLQNMAQSVIAYIFGVVWLLWLLFL